MRPQILKNCSNCSEKRNSIHDLQPTLLVCSASGLSRGSWKHLSINRTRIRVSWKTVYAANHFRWKHMVFYRYIGFLYQLWRSGRNRSFNQIVFQTIKSLMMLGYSLDAKVISTLENEVLWSLRKASIRAHFQVITFHSQLEKSDMQQKVPSVCLISLIPKDYIELHNWFYSMAEGFENSSWKCSEAMGWIERAARFCFCIQLFIQFWTEIHQQNWRQLGGVGWNI